MDPLNLIHNLPARLWLQWKERIRQQMLQQTSCLEVEARFPFLLPTYSSLKQHPLLSPAKSSTTVFSKNQLQGASDAAAPVPSVPKNEPMTPADGAEADLAAALSLQSLSDSHDSPTHGPKACSKQLDEKEKQLAEKEQQLQQERKGRERSRERAREEIRRLQRQDAGVSGKRSKNGIDDVDRKGSNV